jgi:cobalt-zinc-cadmium efflux system outer membrane protein
MSTLRHLFMAALLLTTSGCVSYRAEPIAPAQTAASFAARSLDDPRLGSFIKAAAPEHVGRPGVWDLETLTLAALYFHPDLDIAYAKLRVAEGAVTTAAQRPNPSISLAPQFNVTTATPSPWTAGLAVNLLLETFGKREARTDQVRALAEGARQDIGSAVWQVRGRVRSALVDLWIAQQRLVVAGQRVARETELVGLLERRLAVGEASGLDAARERINRDQASLAVRDAERAATVARTQLASAIGIPAGALEEVTLSLDAMAVDRTDPSDVAIGALRDAALVQRSDVQGALAQYVSAESALRLQVANQYPNLTLGPGYTYDQGDHKYGLSAALDLPIFNQNQGTIAEAAARRKQARASFLALQAQIIGAVDTATAAYRGTTASLATADQLLEAQRARQARSSSLFRVGQIDRPTLVAGEIEVLAVEGARLDAMMVQRQARGQLEDALQQPLFGSAPALVVPPASPRDSAAAPR